MGRGFTGSGMPFRTEERYNLSAGDPADFNTTMQKLGREIRDYFSGVFNAEVSLHYDEDRLTQISVDERDEINNGFFGFGGFFDLFDSSDEYPGYLRLECDHLDGEGEVEVELSYGPEISQDQREYVEDLAREYFDEADISAGLRL